MKRHPKAMNRTKANAELMALLGSWEEKFDLSDAEVLMLLTEYVNRVLQYVVQGEQEQGDERRKQATEGEGEPAEEGDEEEGASVEGAG